jgi:hypothetical protein
MNKLAGSGDNLGYVARESAHENGYRSYDYRRQGQGCERCAIAGRPPNPAFRRINNGQVVKQRIAAHKAAEMNGRRIKRQARAKITTEATLSHRSMVL